MINVLNYYCCNNDVTVKPTPFRRLCAGTEEFIALTGRAREKNRFMIDKRLAITGRDHCGVSLFHFITFNCPNKTN